jgi:hypothetical protein
LDFLNGKYDLFEVEEGVGFLARIIFDPFGVDRDDPERVISYQRCDLEEVVNADPNGVEYFHYKSTIDFLTFPHCNSYRFSLNSYTLSIFLIAFPFANSTTSLSS